MADTGVDVHGAIRRAVELLHDVAVNDLGPLSDGDVRERARLWGRLQDLVTAGMVATTEELSERQSWRDDGAANPTSWVAEQTGLAHNRSRAMVHLANVREVMPAATKAHVAGELSSAKLELLGRCPSVDADQYQADEYDLLAYARRHCLLDVRRHVDEWCDAYRHPDETALRDQSIFDERGFDVSQTFQDSWGLDGTLHNEGGEYLSAALDAAMPTPTADDPRTPRQRRADALVDICKLVLRSGVLGTSGGTPAQINLVADLAVLDPSHDGPVRVDATWTGHWWSETLLRTLCDASVRRVVMDAKSIVVDVGEATHVIPTGLRQAVITRDRGHCTWPGCDRHARWCDIHHILPVHQGGLTEQSNLCTLCSHHHRLLHEGRWTATLHLHPDGPHLEVTPPRAPP